MRRRVVRHRKRITIEPEFPGAAIACYHVIFLLEPVRLVSRDLPQEEDDSGWQFTCGMEGHGIEDGMVVGVHTVLKKHPSVEAVVRALIPGDTAVREGVGQPWQLSHTPPEELDEDQ